MEIDRSVFNRLCIIASHVKDRTASAELYSILRQAERDLKGVPKADEDPVCFLPDDVQVAMDYAIKNKFRDQYAKRNYILCIKTVKEATNLGLSESKKVVDDIWPNKPLPIG